MASTAVSRPPDILIRAAPALSATADAPLEQAPRPPISVLNHADDQDAGIPAEMTLEEKAAADAARTTPALSDNNPRSDQRSDTLGVRQPNAREATGTNRDRSQDANRREAWRQARAGGIAKRDGRRRRRCVGPAARNAGFRGARNFQRAQGRTRKGQGSHRCGGRCQGCRRSRTGRTRRDARQDC